MGPLSSRNRSCLPKHVCGATALMWVYIVSVSGVEATTSAVRVNDSTCMCASRSWATPFWSRWMSSSAEMRVGDGMARLMSIERPASYRPQAPERWSA